MTCPWKATGTLVGSRQEMRCERCANILFVPIGNTIEGCRVPRGERHKYMTPEELAALDEAQRRRLYPGPGTHLAIILAQLGAKANDGCNCAEIAAEMDALGPAGVRAERQKYVDHLKAKYKSLGTLDKLAIASKLSLPMAAGMLFHGAAEWLVDEAIRRAESPA